MSSTTLSSSRASRTAPDGTRSHQGQDAGLLVVRLAVGLTMSAHGAQKLFGWFGGSGIDGTADGFTATGYPSGTLMALLAGLSEFLGGLGLALGLLTPLAGAAIVGTMVNAVVAVHWDAGFFSTNGGYEYPLLLALGAAAIALTGPGRYAVDRLLPVPALHAHRLSHGIAAVALGVVSATVILLIRG